MQSCILQVGNRSSEFHPEIRRVRRSGSYIYEEFMPTGGTDVKVRADVLLRRMLQGVYLCTSCMMSENNLSPNMFSCCTFVNCKVFPVL